MRGSIPLSSFRVRPRFRVSVPLASEVARARLMEALAGLPEGLVVRNFPGLVGLHISEEQRRFWSPRLLLNFDPQPDGTTCIEGVYGPEIEVWSVFLYGYVFSGMIGVLSGIMGGAQFFINGYPWAFWVTAAMVLLAAGFYLAAQFGQKLGAWHTFQLHQVWEGAAARLGALPLTEKKTGA
jgi:hypothetical protein